MITKINIDFLQKIVKEAKILKSEYVLIRGREMIGTNQFMTYIRRTDCNIEELIDDSISFNMKDMTDLLKVVKPTDVLYYDRNSIIVLDGDVPIASIPINDRLTEVSVLDITDKMSKLGYNDAVYNLSENVEFIQAIQGKVGEGMTMVRLLYKNSVLPVSVYGGFVPLNKGDELIARLHYDDLAPTFNMKYIVKKKKGKEIEMYTCYLKL